MVPLAGDMSSEDGEGDTDGMALPLRPYHGLALVHGRDR